MPVLLLLGLPCAVHAQQIQRWRLYRTDGSPVLLDTQKERDEFFNQGNCECEIPMALEVTLTGDYQTPNYKFQIVAGQACLNTTDSTIKSSCTVLFPEIRYNAWKKATWTITEVDGAKLTAKVLMGGICSSQDRTSFDIALYAEPAGDAVWVQDATKLGYTVDTVVPAQVKNASLKAGEGQVTISFDAPYSTTSSGDAGTTTSGETDIKYQVLCEKADGTTAFGSPASAGYDICTTESSTPDASTAADGSTGTAAPWPWPKPRAGDGGSDGIVDGPVSDGPVADTGAVDAGVSDRAVADSTPVDGGTPDSGTSTSGALSLNPKFVCSDTQDSASSIVVSSLTNDERYRFYMVTIDKARNPSTPLLVGEDTPVLAEDLWERYKRLGGTAESGYCFVATAVHGSYDHPHVRVLREFRDQVLLPTREGRLFVDLYYATSPRVASWLTHHEAARHLARAALWPVTLAAAAHIYTTTWHKALFLGSLLLGVGFILRRRQKSARRRS